MHALRSDEADRPHGLKALQRKNPAPQQDADTGFFRVLLRRKPLGGRASPKKLASLAAFDKAPAIRIKSALWAGV
jgi:hypothetical protein